MVDLSEKLAVITLILALFKGGIGLNRFYVKKNGTAIS